jgi:tetratricopeptide (TPR) repeat protein
MSKTGRPEVKVEPAGADRAAVARFEKALALLQKGQWEEASKAFTQVMEGDPGSSIAERSRVFREVCRKQLDSSPMVENDLYLQAVVAKNSGNLDGAYEICNRGGLKGKDARFAYLAAAIESLRGNREESSKLLLKAIELDPSSRVHAFWDPDFADLRKSPELQSLFTPAR